MGVEGDIVVEIIGGVRVELSVELEVSVLLCEGMV